MDIAATIIVLLMAFALYKLRSGIIYLAPLGATWISYIGCVPIIANDLVDVSQDAFFMPDSSDVVYAYYIGFILSFGLFSLFFSRLTFGNWLANQSLQPIISRARIQSRAGAARGLMNFLLLAIAIIVGGFGQIEGVGSLNELLFPEYRGYGESQNLLNVVRLIMSALVVIVYHRFRVGLSSFALFAVCLILSLVYPMAIFSRAASYPLIALAFVEIFALRDVYFSRRLAVLYFLIASYIYYIAIFYRNEGSGITLFIVNMLLGWAQIDFSILASAFFSTFASHIFFTYAYSNIDGGALSIERLIYFIGYLVPLPSVLLPYIEGVNRFVSLSYTINPYSDTGINADFLSETYLWFGWSGMIVAGAIYSAICNLVALCGKKGLPSILIRLGFLLFVIQSNVSSIRSSTRFLALATIIYMLVTLWQRSNKEKALKIQRAEA